MPEIPEKIAFHYIKSMQFRVVHVDGAIGGLTPSGNIHVALFSQRPAIPQRVVVRVTPDGTAGEEIAEEGFSRGGIVRELEVDAMFSISKAKSVRDFLTDQINKFEKEFGSSEQPTVAK